MKWLNVVDDRFSDCYMVSDSGLVKSLGCEKETKAGWVIRKPERILRYSLSEKGYAQVRLANMPHQACCRVHRLVAIAFIPNPEGKPFINHKDGNKLNNNVNNLEWCTQSENMIHSYWELENRTTAAIPILQFSLSGELIKSYRSIKEACRQTGYNDTYITDCVKGKKQKAYGFLWKKY